MKSRRRATETDDEIGRRVRLRRMNLGLSQTDLGKELGVTFQQIQKYEKGSNRVSAGRLQTIATALKVPVTFFYEPLTSQRAHGPPILDFLETANGLRLLQAFARIHDKQMQHAILELVERAADASNR